MSILRIFTPAIGLALLASPAAAQDNNWYLGGSIGYNQTLDQTSEGENRLVETEFDAGITTSSTLGYQFDNNFRTEGEFAWRRNDGDSLLFNGVERPFTAKGAESYSFMLNGIYDFKNTSSITPYVGAGVGVSFIDNEFLYGPANFEDSDTALAWQGFVGASMPLTDKIVGFIDAKYFSATGVEFTRTTPMDNGVDLDSEYDNFGVSVGYRWNF